MAGQRPVPEATTPPQSAAIAETEVVEEIPTSTNEPMPTETAVPTETISPTNTPEPTATEMATETPEPTATTEPTATPEPTAVDLTADFQTATGEWFSIQYPADWLGDVQFGIGVLGTSEEAQTEVFNEGVINEGAVVFMFVENRADTEFASDVSVTEALSILLEDADDLTLSDLDGPHEIVIGGHPAATAIGKATPEDGEPFFFVSTVIFQGDERVAQIGGFVAESDADLVPTVQAIGQTVRFVEDEETAVHINEFIAAELIRLGLPSGYDWETRAGASAGANGITGGRLALASSEKARHDNQADFDAITLEYAQGTNRIDLTDDLLLVVWAETYERLELVDSTPLLALTAVLDQSPAAITTFDEPRETIVNDKPAASVTRATTSLDGTPLAMQTMVIFSNEFAAYATFYYPESAADTWLPVIDTLLAEMQLLDS